MLAIQGQNFHSWTQRALFTYERTALIALTPAWHQIFHRAAEYLESNRHADNSLFWMIEGTGDTITDITDHLLRFQEALTEAMLADGFSAGLLFVQQWFGRLLIALVEKSSGKMSVRHSLSEPMETVFHKARDGMYISSFEGQFLHANQALLDMMGYQSLEELKKLNIADQMYVDTDQRAIMLEHLKEDGYYDLHEFQFYGSGGEVHIALESCYLVEPRPGERFIVGTLVDVTREKEAERKTKSYIAELEAKMLAANLNANRLKRGMEDLLNLPDYPVMLVSANDFHIVEVNNGFRKRFGYRKKDLNNLHLKNLFAEQDWYALFPELSDIHNRFHFHLPEVQALAMDGESFWVRPKVLVHHHPEGVQFFIELMDREETRVIQRRNKHLEQAIKTLVDGCPFGIMVFGSNGDVQYLNRSLRQLMGYTKDQMMNAEFINNLFTMEEQRYKFNKYIRHFLAGRHVEGMEIRLKPKTGKTMDFLLKTIPFRFKIDDGEGFLAFLTDISKAKQLERLLKSRKRKNAGVTNTHLEQKLETLQESQLRAQGQVDVLQRLFDALAERMGIGLETAIGFSSLIHSELANVPRGNSENMRLLFHQMAELDHMLNNSELYSRWSQKAPIFHPGKKAFLPFFRELAKRLKPPHLPAKVHWVVEEHLGDNPDNEWALFDPLAVERIVNQLVHNAAKFTNRGAITLSANLEADQIVISVSDSGIGIEPTDAERIFEPFFQATNQPCHGIKGLGLGLSLATLLAESFGSVIRFKSYPNEGSTFSFALPRIRD
ncbi:MAG: PAS domain S-box protein [Acidobacteria bacterium]|nr:PAS domain S-box protein [Acidobacteriota bacterium]